MVFSSLTFIAFFFPITVILYYVCKNKTWRNCVLTVLSLIFYAWGEPKFVLIMILSIGVNYAAGILMDKAKSAAARTVFMIVGVGLSVAFLFYFKYFSFIVNIFGADVPAKILPIGISFYTFQIITYTVDVWRRKVPTQKNIIKLALYISFFPQLIAGPIVNYTYIEPYLDERVIDPSEFFNGLCRFFAGFGKKILIANMCGEILSYLDLSNNISVLAAWLGAIAYTFQIYFDFSGYSDMAIGMGKMFGFPFLENFNYPYTSISITDFWRRWHISLSTFFRDYVYIPLGGNRVKPARHILNLMIVWALTGFWHGASWNFIIWGVYYGIFLILEKYVWGKVLDKLPKVIRWIYTMLIVIIAWVFFYHDSLSEGLHHLGAMFGIGSSGGTDSVSIYCVKAYAILLAIAVIACIRWKPILEKLAAKNRKMPAPEARMPGRRVTVRQVGEKLVRTRVVEELTQPTAQIIIKFVLCSAIFVLGLIFLAGSSFNPFLYFRF